MTNETTNNATFTHTLGQRHNTPFNPNVHVVRKKKNDFDFVISDGLQDRIDVLAQIVTNGHGRMNGNTFQDADVAITGVIKAMEANVDEHTDFVNGLLHCPKKPNRTFVCFFKCVMDNFHNGNDHRNASDVGDKLIKLLRMTVETTKDNVNNKQTLLLLAIFDDVKPFKILKTTKRGKTNFLVSDAILLCVKLCVFVDTGTDDALFTPVCVHPNGTTKLIVMKPYKLLEATFAVVEVVADTMTLNGQLRWLKGNHTGQNGHDILSELLYHTYLPLSDLDPDRQNPTNRLSTANATLAHCVQALFGVFYAQYEDE